MYICFVCLTVKHFTDSIGKTLFRWNLSKSKYMIIGYCLKSLDSIIHIDTYFDLHFESSRLLLNVLVVHKCHFVPDEMAENIREQMYI